MKSIRMAMIVGAALTTAQAPGAGAEAYPSKTITIVVPFAPGGPSDLLARLLGQRISDDLGQPVIIDNRSGANSIIGAQAVARAAPNGYTLLMAIDGTLAMNQYLQPKLGYDPLKDFAPISLVARVPSAVIGQASLAANSIKELVAQEKAKPGSLQIGISTPTSQVNVGLLNIMAGTSFTTVPYRGAAPQMTGLLAGDVPLAIASVSIASPHWRAKKVKLLGLVDAQRVSFAPDVPTIAETFPGYDLGLWQSIVAPAGTPREIVMTLHHSINHALAAPTIREKLVEAGIEPAGSASPEEFGAFVRAQAEMRAKVIQTIGINAE